MSKGSIYRYILVGFANTIIGYGLIMLLHFEFGLSPVIANATGYAVGFCVSFFMNSKFTFKSHKSYRSTILVYAISAIVCYIINILVLQLFLVVVNMQVEVSQALATVAYTASFYLANRLFVFKVGAAKDR
jgi:putative flippase GtrA